MSSPRGILPHRSGAPILLTLLCLFPQVCSPAFSQSPAPAGKVSDDKLIEIISTPYTRLEEYAQASGLDLHFELSGFMTLEPQQWSSISWFEAATPPGGDSIGASRSNYRDASGLIKSIEFSFYWTLREDYRLTDEGKRFARMTLEQAIFSALNDGPRALEVTRVTVFQVRVSMNDKARSYSALVLWDDRKADATGEGLNFNIVDNVTTGVFGSYEELPPDEEFSTGKRTLGKPPAVQPDNQVKPFQPKAQSTTFPCQLSEISNSFSLQFEANTNHITGVHNLYGTAYYKCKCIESCSQTCSITSMSGAVCQDSGNVTGYCHVLSIAATDSHDEDVFDTRVVGPASCSAAVACGLRECKGCQCNVGITIGWSGSGFFYTPTFGASSISKSRTHQCQPCNTIKPPDGGSPILIDLDGKGFALTGLADPVSFDIDGDSVLDWMSWTDTNSGDAYLALDRNQDGEINSGLELFGNHTTQPTSNRPNGYAALAVFDDNRDGKIDLQDTVFEKLLLWIDTNRDAVSQVNELSKVKDSTIESLDLNYRESRRKDRFGNEFRFSANAQLKDKRVVQSADVFFLLQ